MHQAPPWARVSERCHSSTALGASASCVQPGAASSKSSLRSRRIPMESESGIEPDEDPSFQLSPNCTACGNDGGAPNRTTNGVRREATAPAPTASYLDAATTE